MSRTSIILAVAGLAASLSAVQAAGPPANLCQELVAFVHPKAPDAPAAAQAQPAPAAVQAPDKGAAQLPSGGAGETQQKSGLSGPVAQNGPGASGPQGQAQAQSQAAPAPSGAPAQKGPSPEQVAQVDAAAGANDIQACRAAARAMRKAGVVMPAPLLALSALDPKFFAQQ
ncbi:hypothetical protein SAMN02799631_01618 [Methylobacterium sp. 174MFSha1.1]|uniref:hypothetical protein n=1 Tax=Methylobacterium sp. 174MFSha1.1 TaxID=1502749 RepID=UPI0008E0D627|nr:hypothetical protein [Methylobacterium sp. 174MFSha1.1]SFU65535.1 hypothetical protein SAMN02799631_01618 [Methylobacterium sp. 174MFSha1.1]